MALAVLILLQSAIAALAQTVTVATSATNRPLEIVPREEMPRRTFKLKEPKEMPFYVFNNSVFPPVKNFCPSGYMGDIPDISLTGCYSQVLQDGYPSLRITYKANGGANWAGIMWQNPANNWGELNGGYNLTNAKKLSFWVRGQKGGEVVEFKMGGITSNFPDTDLRSSGLLTLSNTWKQYSIDLQGAQMQYISGGFCIVVKKDDNARGCIVFLDDVKYE